MGVLRANHSQAYRCGSSVRYKSVPVGLGNASIGRRMHEQRGPAGREIVRSPIAANAQQKTGGHAAERGSAEASCTAPVTQDGAAASHTDADCEIETSGEQNWWDELPGKYKILAASSMAFVICNMDKVNMSVAIIPMASDFGWGPSVAGLVQSSFFWGYFLCQIPGGYFSSRFSGSRVLPTGVGLWSLATAAVPILGSSVSGLCFSRSLVGLGEAVSPAAATDMVARLMPKEERSRAVAFIFSGLHLGSLIGLLISPFLIENFGWQSVFTSFGVLGLAWVVWFQSVVSEVEEREPGLVKGLMEIRQVRKQGTDSAPVPWRAMVRARPVQALMFTHFCSNWFQFTMLAWLPTYLSDTLGVSLTNAAELSLLPPLVAITISAIAGPSADALISRGWKTATVRKLAQCIAFLGPLVCLTGASLSDDGIWNVAFISSALGLASFSLAGLYCNHQDLSPKYSAFLLGITNTAGALPGILGVPFTGLLLDYTDSWPLALFLPSMFFFLAGSIVFTRYGRAELAEFNDNRRFGIEDKVQSWFRQLQK